MIRAYGVGEGVPGNPYPSEAKGGEACGRRVVTVRVWLDDADAETSLGDIMQRINKALTLLARVESGEVVCHPKWVHN